MSTLFLLESSIPSISACLDDTRSGVFFNVNSRMWECRAFYEGNLFIIGEFIEGLPIAHHRACVSFIWGSWVNSLLGFKV